MSTLGKLNWRDLIDGALLAVGTAVVTTFYSLFQSKGFNLTENDLYTILMSTFSAFLGYILKQLGTDENGKFGGKI